VAGLPQNDEAICRWMTAEDWERLRSVLKDMSAEI